MRESIRHKELKAIAREKLSVEFGVPKNEFEEDFELKQLPIRWINNGKEMIIYGIPDLYHKNLKVWCEVGHCDPLKKLALTNSEIYKDKFRHYPYPSDFMPQSAFDSSERRMTYDEIDTKLKEVAEELFAVLKDESAFSLSEVPYTYKREHYRYLMKESVLNNYFNLLGSYDNEEKLRNNSFYIGVSLSEFGEYTVFIESCNSDIIDKFMKQNYRDICKLFSDLRYSKYITKAGFGYAVPPAKGHTFYHSWTRMKPNFKDWFGQTIDPKDPGNVLYYDSKKMTPDDFSDINNYFSDLKTSNHGMSKEYRRYPRLCLIILEGLSRDEVLPVVKDLAPIYSKVKTMPDLRNMIVNYVLDGNKPDILELIEAKDYDELMKIMNIEFNGIDGTDIRKLCRDMRIKKSISDWNEQIKKTIIELSQKYDIHRFVHHQPNRLKEIHETEGLMALCSLDKFMEICEKLEMKK